MVAAVLAPAPSEAMAGPGGQPPLTATIPVTVAWYLPGGDACDVDGRELPCAAVRRKQGRH